MAHAKDEAIEIARSFLKLASKKHRIKSAYLFGSYANGVVSAHSDIDVAVILSSPARDKSPHEESFAQEYNSLLEILCFRHGDLEADGTNLYANIKKKGVRIDFYGSV